MRINLSDDLIPLSALPAGNLGRIHSVVGSSDLVRHLAELGLQSGTLLEMVRPGAASILRVNGTKLCIRGDELLCVLITPLPIGARHSA